MAMGRPIRSSAVAGMAALLACWWLFTLQLPTPASAVVPAFVFRGVTLIATPIIKKVVADYVIRKGTQGVSDISRSRKDESESDDGDQLGSAAAGDVGIVVLSLNVGTSAAKQKISFVIDITYSGFWAQCDGCTGGSCLSTATFRSADSTSFSPVPCDSRECTVRQTCADDNFCRYRATYSDGSIYSSGILATETFTAVAVGNKSSVSFEMVFGCSGRSSPDFSGSGASGVIGFARGVSRSLVSQLKLSRFSYLLATDDSDGSSSVIRLGDDAVPQTKRSRSTPLLTSDMYPKFYYVSLTGIKLDGKDLADFPAEALDLAPDGTGGVFLSTTMPTTYLKLAAYSVLRRELVNKIQEQRLSPAPTDNFHLCYATPDFIKIKVPKLALLLLDGAAMELRTENYFFAADGKTCLSILPSKSVSVLGSMLQTGTNMIYDIDGQKLTFETAAAAAASSSHLQAPVSIFMITSPLLLILCSFI